MPDLAPALAALSFDSGIATRIGDAHALFPHVAHRIAHALRLADPAVTVARATMILTRQRFDAPPAIRRRAGLFGWRGPGGHIVLTPAAIARMTDALAQPEAASR